MQAVILAAGEGIRMRPLTLTTPKPLLKVGNKTLLEHLVSNFSEDIKEIILVVGYLGEQFEQNFGKQILGRPIKYVWQKQKLGTYHALKLCKSFLDGSRFCLFYADDLIDQKTVEDLIQHPLAVVTHEVNDPRPFGVITTDQEGRILEIEEKPENPKSNTILANGYVLDDRIFNYEPPQHPKSGEYYLSTAAAQMAREHKIMVVKANFWFPIASPEDLKKAEEILAGRC